MILKAFASVLKNDNARREENGLTMRQLAERLDVHHSWIGRVELGERRLDVMEFVRYCHALEADPTEGIIDPAHKYCDFFQMV